jgi:hypothetical protein
LCTDIQRKKFSDLFALAEVDEVETATPKPSGGSKASAAGRGRKAVSSNSSAGGGNKGAAASKSRAATKEVSESSEESSEVSSICDENELFSGHRIKRFDTTNARGYQ